MAGLVITCLILYGFTRYATRRFTPMKRKIHIRNRILSFPVSVTHDVAHWNEPRVIVNTKAAECCILFDQNDKPLAVTSDQSLAMELKEKLENE